MIEGADRRSAARSAHRLATLAAVLTGAAVCAVPAAAGGDDAGAVGLSLVRGVAAPVLSPNGDGVNDTATIRFGLARPARVILSVGLRGAGWQSIEGRRGMNEIRWTPGRAIRDGTYTTALTATFADGRRARLDGPVLRVRRIAARFRRDSYDRESVATLEIATDARAFSVSIFLNGYGKSTTGGHGDGFPGFLVRPPASTHYERTDNRPWTAVPVTIKTWLSGLYLARVTTDDGRVAYAPFVVRPDSAQRSRVAVVLPTNTWQAYNLYDANLDGRGDTWYAGWLQARVPLSRPYADNGLPPRFRAYDLAFQRWLARRHHRVDMLTDDDLAAVPSGDVLARRYDAIFFPGHHEYVTSHEFDVIERYRDLGGNLAFLSANNFYWRVVKRQGVMRRTARFRDLGRPEAALIGVQYRASDDATRRGGFTVRHARAVPWLFAAAGLGDGDTFGSGFGIEIDMTTKDSPPGIRVIASIRDILGKGLTAQMTYYETPAGARVFAAGAFTLGGARGPVVWSILDNLWERLSRP